MLFLCQKAKAGMHWNKIIIDMKLCFKTDETVIFVEWKFRSASEKELLDFVMFGVDSFHFYQLFQASSLCNWLTNCVWQQEIIGFWIYFTTMYVQFDENRWNKIGVTKKFNRFKRGKWRTIKILLLQNLPNTIWYSVNSIRYPVIQPQFHKT